MGQVDVHALYVLKQCLLVEIWYRVGRSCCRYAVLWSILQQTQHLTLGVVLQWMGYHCSLAPLSLVAQMVTSSNMSKITNNGLSPHEQPQLVLLCDGVVSLRTCRGEIGRSGGYVTTHKSPCWTPWQRYALGGAGTTRGGWINRTIARVVCLEGERAGRVWLPCS